MDLYELSELDIIRYLEENNNNRETLITKKLIRHVIDQGYLILFHYILEKIPIDYESNYMLRTVAKRGSMKMLTLLIKNGVDLHYNKDRAFELAYREFRWQKPVAKFLLESGADPAVITTYRILEPCHRGYFEDVQFAIEKKLIPASPENLNELLRFTTSSTHIIYYLLSIGANIEAIFDSFTKWCSFNDDIAEDMIDGGFDLDENMDDILYDVKSKSRNPEHVFEVIFRHQINDESFEKVAVCIHKLMKRTSKEERLRKFINKHPRLKERVEELSQFI